MEGTTTTTLSTILDAVTQVFTASIGWVGSVADTIADEPLLLTFAVIPLVGLGIGMMKRLMNIN